MLNQVPKHLLDEVESTLAILDTIQPVEPPKDLAGRILARLHEARQPGYFPFLDKNQGEDLDKEDWEFAEPQLFSPVSNIEKK